MVGITRDAHICPNSVELDTTRDDLWRDFTDQRIHSAADRMIFNITAHSRVIHTGRLLRAALTSPGLS